MIAIYFSSERRQNKYRFRRNGSTTYQKQKQTEETWCSLQDSIQELLDIVTWTVAELVYVYRHVRNKFRTFMLAL
jgi:hypothetical protein